MLEREHTHDMRQFMLGLFTCSCSLNPEINNLAPLYSSKLISVILLLFPPPKLATFTHLTVHLLASDDQRFFLLFLLRKRHQHCKKFIPTNHKLPTHTKERKM
ncbi:unnamed protein product [Musa acuminata subsp. burmannicoides]